MATVPAPSGVLSLLLFFAGGHVICARDSRRLSLSLFSPADVFPVCVQRSTLRQLLTVARKKRRTGTMGVFGSDFLNRFAAKI